MTEKDLKDRTKAFALAAISFADQLPRSLQNDVLSRQFVRCATSVGANYRSACRAKSTADMLAKLAICEEESDECISWLELIATCPKANLTAVEALVGEADQLVAILVASIKTLRKRK